MRTETETTPPDVHHKPSKAAENALRELEQLAAAWAERQRTQLHAAP